MSVHVEVGVILKRLECTDMSAVRTAKAVPGPSSGAFAYDAYVHGALPVKPNVPVQARAASCASPATGG